MTALTVDVIRVFFAFVVVTAIITIAVVIITNTADVDSMADPAPRPGEDDYEERPGPGSALQRAQTVPFPDRSRWME